MVPGAADLLFLWDTGSGAIEIKTKKGTLSPDQRDFRDWCMREGVPYEVCRSGEEVEEVLRRWGRL